MHFLLIDMESLLINRPPIYSLPIAIKEELLANRLAWEPLVHGHLFEIHFKMQGAFSQFHQYLKKHTTIALFEMYSEDHYNYYRAVDTIAGNHFYLQIFQDCLYFNYSPTTAIDSFVQIFEVIKSALDPAAEIWIGKKRLV
jgi:hypothetical protein